MRSNRTEYLLSVNPPHLGAAGLEIPEDAMRPETKSFRRFGGGVASDYFSRRRN